MPRVPAVDPTPDEVLVKADLEDLAPEALRNGYSNSGSSSSGSGPSSNGAQRNGSSNGNGHSSADGMAVSTGDLVAPWVPLVHQLRAPSNGSAKANEGSGTSRARQLPPFREGCPPLLIGGNGLGEGMYHSDDVIRSLESYRMFRLAFEYGLNAIDTSPYYHPSEIRLGRILRTLAPQFPRQSYYLCTKAGRNGPDKSDFDYSAQSVRRSVERSCKRMETSYLDAVLMHDVEFVADLSVQGSEAGFAARDLVAEKDESGPVHVACGLAPAQAGKSYGPGDELILEAVSELFKLKDEGVVNNVGISGYPLPTLLRLTRLVFARLHRPLDVVLSYSHHTLQSDLLVAFLDLFERCPGASEEQDQHHQWQPPRVLNASPFSMGLLTDDGPPAWHPAPLKLKSACTKASETLRHSTEPSTNLSSSSSVKLPSLTQTAARFGMRGAVVSRSDKADGAALLPTLVGMRDVEQVHAAVDAYRVLLAGVQGAAASRRSETDSAANVDGNKNKSTALLSKGKPLVDESVVAMGPTALTQYEAQQKAEVLVRDELQRAGFCEWSWASPG